MTSTSTRPTERLEGYIYNAWYMAGWVSELDADKSTARILNEPLVLYRTAAGRWVAFEDLCPHKLVPLSFGKRIGDCLRCGYHGLKFDEDGRCVEIPGQAIIPPSVRVRTYPAVEKHGGVWIWMGDPERADEGALPAIIGEGDAGYQVFSQTTDIDGSARMLWDNLLDLTHIPFLHFDSLIGGDPSAAAAIFAAEVAKNSTPHDRGIAMDSWHIFPGRPDLLGHGRPLEEHAITDFSAPGVLTINIDSYEVGIREAFPQGDIPADRLLLQASGCQIVVPVTESTCKVFHNSGNWDKAPPDEGRKLRNAKAIIEDKLMIEAQQASMRANPQARPLMLSMDRNVARFRSIMSRLVEQDAQVLAAQ
ncbi:aromatic ring-hydroxylating dioxygenase subunit alpha [Caulobacter soli]|uniref:aromatic ring-hydroxylating dioxygenase subunit alpha n=1 Tax=Caulobacter soli TaxID=2708539 RepID=UPI0013EA5F09|nr:aromatic ring-hydroxylating dioxygenase subunit alpha [Caulobacter soli]